MTGRFSRSSPDIVHEDFDGDLVILNLQTGEYFGLNLAAATLWNEIMAGRDPTLAAGDAGTRFVGRLQELGLVIASDDPPETTAPLSLDAVPVVDVYSDLSDLILADPIHDVDEAAGWPKRPDEG